ncbi:MAG: glycosyltransferase [Thiobacillus sp.]
MDHFNPALISVVMPCHNSERFIEAAIESVIQQTYPLIELIVVNDGSTDASPALIDRLATAHADRISVRHQLQSGPYAARNAALSKAHGNFVAFLDADDLWDANALQKMHAALIETQADVAYCGWQRFGESARDTRPQIPVNYAESDATALFLEESPWPINGVLIRRQLLDSLRGFSERKPTAMDYDLWLRLLAQQPVVVRVPEVLAYRRYYPRGAAHIPIWRQVFDAVAVREDFVRRYPAQVAHLTPLQRKRLVYGTLLPTAYRCHWRRDTESSRRLFRRALRKSDWHARDAKYLLASFLPASWFNGMIAWVDHARASREVS